MHVCNTALLAQPPCLVPCVDKRGQMHGCIIKKKQRLPHLLSWSLFQVQLDAFALALSKLACECPVEEFTPAGQQQAVQPPLPSSSQHGHLDTAIGVGDASVLVRG
jgi:hypothetical protein